jgi:hypothetical protein
VLQPQLQAQEQLPQLQVHALHGQEQLQLQSQSQLQSHSQSQSQVQVQVHSGCANISSRLLSPFIKKLVNSISGVPTN